MFATAGYNRNSTCPYKTLDGTGTDAKNPGDFLRGEQRRHPYRFSGWVISCLRMNSRIASGDMRKALPTGMNLSLPS